MILFIIAGAVQIYQWLIINDTVYTDQQVTYTLCFQCASYESYQCVSYDN